MYKADYQWLTFDHSTISVQSFLYMTLEGHNVRIINSVINVTNTIQVSTFQAFTQCDYYLPEKSGIANNFIMDNTTVISLNLLGWDQFMHFQNHINITITNNLFYDMEWKDHTSLMVETFQIDCPFDPYTKIVFENNTILNPTVKRLSNIYFTMSLSQQGVTDIIIRNNLYQNIFFSSPGLFKITKPQLSKVNVLIANLTLIDMWNSDVPTAFFTVEAEKVLIDRVSITSSQFARFIKLRAMRSTLSRIVLDNNFRADNSRVVESADALIHVSQSSNLIISDFRVTNASFGLSQVLALYQSTNVSLVDVTINGCTANFNHLFYLYIVQDFSVTNLSVSNISKASSAQVSLFQLGLLSPWDNSSPGRLMTLRLSNISFVANQVQFLHLEGISASQGSQNPIFIHLEEVSIRGIALRGKENLFRLMSFVYPGLSLYMKGMALVGNSVELGSMFKLEQSCSMLSIEQITYNDNVGNFMTISSEGIQKVQLKSLMMMRNHAKEALIHAQRGVALEIDQSRFKDNYSLSRGSIVLAESGDTQVSFVNTRFIRNHALYGGVVFVQIFAHVIMSDCLFEANFAYLGGVLYQQSEGQATFRDSTFTANLAVHASIVYTINSQSAIEISGGEITHNGFQYLPKHLATSMFGLNSSLSLSTGYLETLGMLLKMPLATMVENVYEKDPEDYQIQVVKALVSLQGGVTVRDQVYLLHQTSASIALIDGLAFRDISTTSPLVTTESSIIEIKNLSFVNISSSSYALSCLSDTIGAISSIDAANSSFALLYAISSQLNITDLMMSSLVFPALQSGTGIIEIVGSQLIIENVVITSIRIIKQLKNPKIINLISSKANIQNVQASNFEGLFLEAQAKSAIELSNSLISDNLESRLTLEFGVILATSSHLQVNNCTFRNLKGGKGSAIYVESPPKQAQQDQVIIRDSQFINNTALGNGGAILVKDVDLLLINSSFIANQALSESGGAVMSSCSIENEDVCNFTLENNSFVQNKASMKGGAIYYDLYSPNALESNLFLNNTALYGPDIASYPFSLQVIMNEDSLNLTGLVSGGLLSAPIYVGIYDQEGQIVTIDDEQSDAYLFSQDVSLQVTGNYKQVSDNGIYRFNELIFVAAPSYKTEIKVISNALNPTRYFRVTGDEFKDYSLELGFRECIEGEVAKNNKCSRCIKGTYSYSPFDAQCTPCFDFATCEGGNKVVVDQGYWRKTNLSTVVYKCPLSAACLGGVESKCATGYSGLLCNICGTDDEGNIYGREGASMCTKCPSLYLQLLQFFAVMLGLFAYTGYLLNSVLSNPLRNKPQTVLIRVLTNYFQVVMIVKNFDLKWPSQIESALEVFSFITSSLELLVSFDCMMLKSGFARSTNYSSFYYKVIAYGVAPVIIALCSAAFWSAVYCCKSKRQQRRFKLSRYITQTSFIVIYLLYPTITNLSFSLFNCVRLEDGDIYLKRDFTVKCWQSTHTQMAFYIGVPVILIWVIGLPLFIFVRLWQNRNQLNEKQVVLNYGLFYVGLDDHAYFWEIVVTNVRKVIFIICGTILSPVNSTIKVLIGIIIIYTQTQWRSGFRPYFDPRFNSVEFHSQFAAVFTFFVGLMFVQEELRNNNNTLLLLFVIVLAYNIFFLVAWVRQFLNVIVRVHYKRIKGSRYCRCLRRFKIKDYDRDLKAEKRKSRQEEREKKLDQLLSGAKYVPIMGGGGRVALKLNQVGVHKNFAEDLLFHAKRLNNIRYRRKEGTFVSLLMGDPRSFQEEFPSLQESSIQGKSGNLVSLKHTTTPSGRQLSRSIGVQKLKLDDIVPDENSIAFYYSVKRQRAHKKVASANKNLDHRLELYHNLQSSIKKRFDLDERPFMILRDRGHTHFTVEDSRFNQHTSGPLSVYEEDTEPRRVRLRNRAKLAWSQIQRRQSEKLRRQNNMKLFGASMDEVQESDDESSNNDEEVKEEVESQKSTRRGLLSRSRTRFKSGKIPQIAVELLAQSTRARFNSQKKPSTPIVNPLNPFSASYINSNYGFSLPAAHMIQSAQADPMEREIISEIKKRQSQHQLDSALAEDRQDRELRIKQLLHDTESQLDSLRPNQVLAQTMTRTQRRDSAVPRAPPMC